MRRVTVDLGAIAHNLQVIKDTAKGARIIAVVKSDAYGHGMVEVARLLARMGVWGFGLAELDEVERLRKAGLRGEWLLMAGVPRGLEEEAVALGAHVALLDPGQLAWLDRAGRRLRRRARVHIKVETGMGRFGLPPQEVFALLQQRDRWPNVRFSGLFTHLSSADDPSDPLTEAQLRALHGLIDRLRAAGIPVPMVHAANTAALFHFPQARHQAVRPGIGLYGGVPWPAGSDTPPLLRPAMAFSTRIASVKELPAGHPVGYSHTFTTSRPSRVAVLPVGYDDGYLRGLSNRGQVLIHGRRCPVVGNVCMKAVMVDVTHCPAAEVGSEAVLLGPQGSDAITPWELAEWAGTISYELLCLVGTRNPREFLRPQGEGGE